MTAWRVGLVGPLPPPAGGMANQTLQLSKLLTEAGLSVELVQVNAVHKPAFVRHLKGIRAVVRLAPYVMRLWRIAGRVDLLHLMANSGWSWHLFAAPAVWIGLLRRKPVVVNYRGGEAGSFFATSWFVVRPTIKRAAAVIVPSRYLQRIFSAREVTTTIVPNIIDLDLFANKGHRNAREHLDNGPRIVIARNLEAIYDIPTGLRAFAEIRRHYPSATLTVAGSGPLRDELEQLTERIGIAEATHFTGRLANREMKTLYTAADLMVNSSLADNMPISMLEAWASGVPVVSTNVGGIPDLVENNEAALLVPPGEPKLMAEAALSVLGDDERANSMMEAGHVLVERFTWNHVREELFAVYTKVAGKHESKGLMSQI